MTIKNQVTPEFPEPVTARRPAAVGEKLRRFLFRREGRAILFKEMESGYFQLRGAVRVLEIKVESLEAAINEMQVAAAKPEKRSSRKKLSNVVAMPARK